MFTLDHRYGDTSPLPVDWLARIASTITRFWSRSRRERHVRLVNAELQALDDRMLKDIGLYRCEIESAVLNPARGEWHALVAPVGWPVSRHRKHIAAYPDAT